MRIASRASVLLLLSLLLSAPAGAGDFAHDGQIVKMYYESLTDDYKLYLTGFLGDAGRQQVQERHRAAFKRVQKGDWQGALDLLVENDTQFMKILALLESMRKDLDQPGSFAVDALSHGGYLRMVNLFLCGMHYKVLGNKAKAREIFTSISALKEQDLSAYPSRLRDVADAAGRQLTKLGPRY